MNSIVFCDYCDCYYVVDENDDSYTDNSCGYSGYTCPECGREVDNWCEDEYDACSELNFIYKKLKEERKKNYEISKQNNTKLAN